MKTNELTVFLLLIYQEAYGMKKLAIFFHLIHLNTHARILDFVFLLKLPEQVLLKSTCTNGPFSLQ